MSGPVTFNDIARRDSVFHHGGYPTFKIGCKNAEFMFYVLPPAMMPSFTGFTYALIATKKNEREPGKSAVFGMSQDVPEDFREFVAYFEVFHRWYGMDCYSAVQGEVHNVSTSSLPVRRFREYAEWRQDFFTRLVVFAREHNESEDVIAAYEKAATYFFTLQSTLPH